MVGQQAALAYVKDALEKGEIKAGQGNVLLVQLMGVRIVGGSMPRQVRKELMDAVKIGELDHLKKDGLKPEAFFHKNARSEALEMRSKFAGESIESLRKAFC
jgi:hypothetical protein